MLLMGSEGGSVARECDVIVVDDDHDILRLVGRALSGEGFGVRLTSSLEECRDAMKTFDASLFVIDVKLPDGSGLTLLQEIRARSNAGILMLSGRAEEIDQVLGLEMGADDYLAKPVRPRELVARLRALERRLFPAPVESPETTTGPTPDFVIAGYGLFLSARRLVSPSGRDVALTAAEFDVLAALVEFKGKVASRDQIIEAVRRRNWSGNERAIDGIISRLRRKLPLQGARQHFIRTVHGVGYMITS